MLEGIVRRHHGERQARGLRCWDQFVAMLFCRYGRTQSLNEIHQGLQANEGKLVHLGDTKAHEIHPDLAFCREIPDQKIASLLGI